MCWLIVQPCLHSLFFRVHCLPARVHDAVQSVDQHFMTSYHHAILSVILAQFTAKGFADGMEGVAKLIEASNYLKVALSLHTPGAFSRFTAPDMTSPVMGYYLQTLQLFCARMP